MPNLQENELNITGVVTTNDTGTVTSTMIADGTIANVDVSTSAAISHSKLANITAGSVLLGNATNIPTATVISGDVTVNSSGVTAIGSGVIVDADISASAAITLSKLANSTAGNILIYNASGVLSSVAESGDVTIDSSGVSSITANSIVNADINTAAAIAYSKTNLSNSIVNADINTAAAIAKTKISGTAITAADTSTVTNAMLVNTSVTIGSTAISLGSTSTTISGLTSLTTSNSDVTGKLKVSSVGETLSVSATAATGTIIIDYYSSPSVFYSANATSNWTLNIRGNSSLTLNNALATNEMATVVFMAQQGATAYYANVVQIDGTTITPKWQGGTAPSAGNASSIDSYALSILKTAANTYTVFASQTKFA